MVDNSFTPEVIHIDDDNQYETKDEMMEVHTDIIDNDFDDIGFEPIVDTSESFVDDRFGY